MIWNSYEKKPSTSLSPIGKCSIFNKRVRYCFQNKLVKVGCLSEKRQRNQRSNCQHLLYHQKGKRIPEKKTSVSALLTMPKPLIVWITKIMENY